MGVTVGKRYLLVLIVEPGHDLVERVERRPHVGQVVRLETLQLVDAVCREPARQLRRPRGDGVLAGGEGRDEGGTLGAHRGVAGRRRIGESAEQVASEVAVQQAPLVVWGLPSTVGRGRVGYASLEAEGVQKPVYLKVVEVLRV